MAETKFKQTCQCKNCGNEAEMEITCTLEAHEADKAHVVPPSEGKSQGHGVCSHCGSEADIWLDI
jgi:hypothetical protein